MRPKTNVLVVLTFLSALFCCSTATAQPRLVFFMGARDYYELENMYSAQLWVYVLPGYTWEVGSSLINITYNKNALTAFNTDTVWEVHSDFLQKGYIVRQSDYGEATSLSLTTFGTNWVEIEGAVKLGVLRWSVVDGSQKDSLQIRYGGVEASIVYDSTEFLQGGADINTPPYQYWLPVGLTPRVVDPETAPCTSQYFRDSTCVDRYDPLPTTETPLQDSCMHWHRRMTPTGVGPHVVSYQYDMTGAPNGTTRVLHFLTQSLDSLMDIARCRWTKQLLAGALEWEELTSPGDGGIFRWSRLNADFGLFPSEYIARTRLSVHSNDLSRLVAASPCGFSGQQNDRSEVIFNSTDEFFQFNPHLRWTTDYHTCGYSPRCLDFETIALHEIGHYLGLTHQEKPTSTMWGGYDRKNTYMGECEANSLRRLYSPQLLTQTPVPLPDNSICTGPTDVEEHPATGVVIGSDLQVYPMPITDGQLFIRTQIERATRVALSMLDVTGRTIQVLSDTYQAPGEQHYSFNIDLPSGVYFLKVETDTGSRIEKIVILR